MRPLEALREGWDEMEREEQRLGRRSTIEESAKIFLSLYNTFAPLIIESRELFQPQREAFLTELQLRLRRLEVWRRRHGDTAKSA